MALADLITSLKAEAAAQRDAVMAEARERARRIRADAEAEVGRSRAESLARTEREERDSARRAVSAAVMEASTRVLDSRARLLERIRRSVDVRIQRAPTDPAYLDTLSGELAAALLRMPTGAVEVTVCAELATAVEAAAEGHAAVRVVPAPDGPVGYAVRSADGAVEVDATLPARLELQWPRIAVRLLREVDA
jgi:vacuolar-type H+-ATPase subunit E/Vma4